MCDLPYASTLIPVLPVINKPGGTPTSTATQASPSLPLQTVNRVFSSFNSLSLEVWRGRSDERLRGDFLLGERLNHQGNVPARVKHFEKERSAIPAEMDPDLTDLFGAREHAGLGDQYRQNIGLLIVPDVIP